MKDKINNVLFGMRKDSERRARKLSAKKEIEITNIKSCSSIDLGETGIVVSTTRSGCSVLLQDQIHEIALAAIRPGKDIVVGDNVILTDSIQGKSIESILPRKTSLGRPDPQIPERVRVLAANVDLVIVMVPAGKSGIRSRLVDRFLIAAASSGAQALICVTKIDLLDSDSLDILNCALEPYRQIDVHCIQTSSINGAGIYELNDYLQGKFSVIVGQSGVGKSSILNSLNPALHIRVNEVRDSDGKGRHTTTGSKAYRLGKDTLVIDTPGIRQIGLVGMDSASLCKYFPEFVGFDSVCKFSDCSHIHEPDCGVKMAVRDGYVSVERYESYRKLVMEMDSSAGHLEALSDIDRVSFSKVSFQCIHCGSEVSMDAPGTDHRNHCPRCLWSKHLDRKPGDRLACCSGSMEPVAVWVRSGGEWAIIHRCNQCAHFSSNRIAADDNEMLLLSLAARPISKPPFPLDTLE